MDYNRLYYPWDEYIKDTKEETELTPEAKETMQAQWDAIENMLFGYVMALTM